MITKSDIEKILEKSGIKIARSNDSIMKIIHENFVEFIPQQEKECQNPIIPNQKTT